MSGPCAGVQASQRARRPAGFASASEAIGPTGPGFVNDAMLASSSLSIGHGRRLGGLAVVIALHALVALAVLAATELREVIRAPAPVQVRLLPSAPPRQPEPPRPLTFAPKFVTPPPVTVPMPELPDLPPLPELPAITAAAVPAAEAAPAVTTPGGGDGGAPHPAAPVQVEHIAYARFDPPQYPPLSRRLGEEGVVVLRVLIDERGTPVAVEVHRSSGYARLDDAAREAVRRARFHPYREGAQARPAIALVPVRFELT